MEQRNLVTLKKACELGGFKTTKAYELINAGTLRAYKMGGQTMIDADSIMAYHSTLPQIEPTKKIAPPVPIKRGGVMVRRVRRP